MEHDDLDWGALGWVVGWFVAVLVLFTAALRLPLETRLARWQDWFYSIAVILAAVGVWVLANVAITLHDAHFDCIPPVWAAFRCRLGSPTLRCSIEAW
jgi:hypothetical protein